MLGNLSTVKCPPPVPVFTKNHPIKGYKEKNNKLQYSMVNYNNGKIYLIEPIDGEDGDVYVGSTTKIYLSQRMSEHRNSYNLWKQGKRR